MATALPLARYRLEFTVETALRLPAYSGSALRGAFGHALRSAACMTRQKSCDACPLLATCPYATIFESRLTGEHALQKFTQVPHPYIIEPPQWGERDYAPGEMLSFHLVLAGRALDQAALVFWAFARAFQRGVGRGDGTAQLLRVVHLGEQETVVLDGPGGHIDDHDTTIAPPPDCAAESLTLQFDTPLRLQANGRRATAEEYTPRRLLTTLVRRVALMNEFHGAGPLALDFSGLAAQAEVIRSEKKLHWRDWTRYSSRQDRKMDLGGVIGAWKLSGDLAPFVPFLHLGQWLHVGKEASFGLGGYRLLHAMP
ncbi:MAG: CRISPR system precrRNA processing endoribonuclease RAMP protein Cas6 [Azonexus sp.]|uniref:CRISPR system precrRNA processing endoribonuclease RAMP protein Cas6 n=1 Tax=Azonexus sp. TaxID=1872668 RepID=UPI0028304752|nr:CRISPR system precrRNA processing endoribonuclease RAMP protein Cas6 [Azonexus sp.]MDR0776282.1 CRISPR system precrRNA processing endoribonuclease RAMP protein Cas6 [Azonexus sp.]